MQSDTQLMIDVGLAGNGRVPARHERRLPTLAARLLKRTARDQRRTRELDPSAVLSLPASEFADLDLNEYS